MVGAPAKTAMNGVVVVRGEKLAEAAGYLKQARICLLEWMKQACLGADQVDRHIEDIEDVVRFARELQEMRGRLDIKASALGR